jgi:hypothetical protein
MNRINSCPACNAKKNGVKSRIAFEHICGFENEIPNEVRSLNKKALLAYVDEINGEVSKQRDDKAFMKTTLRN